MGLRVCWDDHQGTKRVTRPKASRFRAHIFWEATKYRADGITAGHRNGRKDRGRKKRGVGQNNFENRF